MLLIIFLVLNNSNLFFTSTKAIIYLHKTITKQVYKTFPYLLTKKFKKKFCKYFFLIIKPLIKQPIKPLIKHKFIQILV